MADNWLQRGTLLLGEEKQERLRRAHILVVGLGGVDSWAAEMLCRAGAGAMTIVDADVVDITNINRQMPALASTVGMPKCDVVAGRLKAINPDIDVTVKQLFINSENIPAMFDEGNFDFVVDAIDTLEPKGALIRECWARGIRVISSMGAGAKCNLADIRQGDLWKSEHCTLAKNVRRLLRDARGKHKLPVIYSMEEPRKSAIRPNPDGGKPIIGSLAYFTAAFGCHIAEYVIKEI
ncbi:MAG: tRNA threonylcarbamoyladenosine dehydratase [Bacteroidaceae bacterium]|nr:tRNA threonylcarbamoyladenosine dehydratase [Bacteroidaceae bacterium]